MLPPRLLERESPKLHLSNLQKKQKGSEEKSHPLLAHTFRSMMSPPPASAMAVPEGYAREAILAWYRGEFAAANAIIDALCAHLVEIAGGDSAAYEAVLAAVHRRRMNWIPVIHMQKFFSIASVASELRLVAAKRKAADAAEAEAEATRRSIPTPEMKMEERDGLTAGISRKEGINGEDYSGDPKIPDVVAASDGGSQGGNASPETNQIGPDHETGMARPETIKLCKGFVSKEPIKGHMVNVVKGLKVYEDIFTDSELLRLSEFIDELHHAGRMGELSGETFIFFNKQMKGNKREIIQLGVPLFQPTNEEGTNNIEPIPQVLQTLIDHLVQWHLIPESKRPNSCIINFFDEDEYSQPYTKPPHLENPISTLLLSDTLVAFGRALTCDHHGNYKGSFTLSLKEGSLLVMHGNSADMARHVICPSSNKRVSITFVKVRSPNNQPDSPLPHRETMALWQPGISPPQKLPTNGAFSNGSHGVVSAWGMALRGPVLMLAPPKPVITSLTATRRANGTGVFLPWTVGPKKYVRHLPPRIQKRRLSSLPPAVETQVDKLATSDSYCHGVSFVYV